MAYTLDWLNLVIRWSHMIAGISWIGASLYFVWLDNHLETPKNPADVANGMYGEIWAVHGGGFYHNQKFMTGPRNEPLPGDLHWFKWEAYTTWLSGIALLAVVYWSDAATYMIDPSVADITPGAAIAISIGTLVAGWLVYDALCRVLGRNPQVLAAAVALFVLLADFGLFHVFGARAAYIHVGAMIGTIMVANVFFVIIPGQRKMLDQIRAGQTPDPTPGINGKIRSVHNTYFTFPVLFIMISNHFPITYANSYGWLVLAAISVAGVLVRQFFVLADKARYVAALPVAAAVLLFATAFVVAPHPAPATAGAGAAAPVAFAAVAPIVAMRCAVCHAAHPTQAGFATAPEGVLLDTPDHIAGNAQRIYAQAVASHAMPIGNITHITDAERAQLAAWIAGGAATR
jgi:uncharacterized membrane protein